MRGRSPWRARAAVGSPEVGWTTGGLSAFALRCLCRGGFIVDHKSLQFIGVKSGRWSVRASQFHGIVGDCDSVVDGFSTRFTGQFQQVDEFFEVAVVDVSGITFVQHANAGSAADDFSHHTTRFHHTSRAKNLMSDADVSSGHKQIFDVATVEASVGNGVAITAVNALSVYRDADERVGR